MSSMVVLQNFFFGCFCILFLSFTSLIKANPDETLVGRQDTNENKSSFPAVAIDFDVKQTPFPTIRQDNVTFTYDSASKGSVEVADPFHWLENLNGTSTDGIKAFNDAQLRYTKEYLSKIPEYESIRSSIKQGGTYKRLFLPEAFDIGKGKDSLVYVYHVIEEGDSNKVYYLANQKELDQGIQTNFSTSYGIKLLDSNFVGDDKDVNSLKISPDGQKFLYTVIDNVRFREMDVYVRNISSPLIASTSIPNEGFTDEIKGSLGANWAAENNSFFYIAFGEDSLTSAIVSSIHYHVLGNDQKDDIQLTNTQDYSLGQFDFEVSNDKKSIIVYLVSWLNATLSESSTIFIASLDQPISKAMKWINLPTEIGRDYFYMSNLGNDYYFSSYKEGKEGRIVHFSVDFTKAKHITTTFQDFKPQEDTKDDVIIPERKNSTMITSLSFDTDKIYVRYSFNDVPLFIIFDLSNRIELLEYPVKYPSSLMDVQGYPFGTTLYFYGAAFNAPIRLYVYEWLSDSFNNPAVLYYQAENDYLHPFDYTIEKRWVPSTNGVGVPIFLLYRNGLQLDGSSPLVLNIYGAYGMNLYPVYDNKEFVLVHDYDSILCFAGIRGGDDHGGEEWHLAAVNGSKQNSIDDTFSVAKYLIEQNFTSKGKIILDGMGAGATTASIVINQDLENYFGFLFIKRGIMDLLRFNDQDDQISLYRIDEYGNPKDPKAFDWLKGYSPIHNINKNKIYPITTIRPGLESDENPAWQSYKYLATLQSSLPKNINPFLLIEADISNDEAAAVVVSIIVHATGIKKVNI